MTWGEKLAFAIVALGGAALIVADRAIARARDAAAAAGAIHAG